MLFERESRLGGHAHTHRIDRHDRTVAVDSGFMVFNHRTYPHFVRLLEELQVESRASDMCFSVCCRRCTIEYSSRGLRGLFACPRTAFGTSHLSMLVDVPRFFRTARRALADGGDDAVTLGDFLDRHRFGEALVRHFVLPMGGAIWSASSTAMRAFPATSYLRFLANHGLLTVAGQPVWRTIVGGSAAYVSRIAARLGAGVHVDRPVISLTRTPTGALVHAAGLDPIAVDAVVVATHADEALSLLADASAEERLVLGAFRYSANPCVLHDDETRMPARPAARASWNVELDDCEDEARPVRITYDLARLQGLDGVGPMLCTLNGGAITGRAFARMSYAHPILDRSALAAQPRLAAMSGSRATYFCGAHLGYGFHEDGVRSALAAVQRLEAAA